MNSTTLSAEDILAIPVDEPHRLFTAENLKKEFRSIRSDWHPDTNKTDRATEVFQHIKAMYELSEDLIVRQEWPGAATFSWVEKDSKFELKYLRMLKNETGAIYVGRKHVLFKYDQPYRALLSSAYHTVNALKYAGPEMRAQFEPLFPVKQRVWEEAGVLLMEKTEDVLPLRLVLNHCKGEVPARHVAWMVNRLHNIAAYFEYNKISHQALCVDNLFVSPEFHSILVLGGWGYASKLDRRVGNVPAQLLDVYPAKLKREKQAILETDQACIKAIGLELLGDPSGTGTRLLKRLGDGDDKIPDALLNELRTPPEESAYQGYSLWHHALDMAYGKRKFVEFNVTAADVY